MKSAHFICNIILDVDGAERSVISSEFSGVGFNVQECGCPLYAKVALSEGETFVEVKADDALMASITASYAPYGDVVDTE